MQHTVQDVILHCFKLQSHFEQDSYSQSCTGKAQQTIVAHQRVASHTPC